VIRVVGLDIHRVFAEAVMLDGHKIIRLGRIGMTREHLDRFARTLTHDDHVVVEATGNATAVSEVLAPHVGRVVIANPRQVRLIAEARIKTDVINATVLAKLYAANFLPEVWVPDQRTLALRRQVTRRRQIVRQRVRLKTMIQSILHAHLVPPCPHADLLGPKGRSWLLAQSLPGATSRMRWRDISASMIGSAMICAWSNASLRGMRSPHPWPAKDRVGPGVCVLLVLPPIIYSSAVAMSWREFHFNLRPISLLAIGPSRSQ